MDTRPGYRVLDWRSVRHLFVVLAGAAEMERNLIRERTKAAMAVKRANGQRVGSVPYGYDLAADGIELRPNPSEQTIIVEIRAMRADGTPLTGIAACLSEHRIPTKTRRSDRWTHQAVRRILDRQLAQATRR